MSLDTFAPVISEKEARNTLRPYDRILKELTLQYQTLQQQNGTQRPGSLKKAVSAKEAYKRILRKVTLNGTPRSTSLAELEAYYERYRAHPYAAASTDSDVWIPAEEGVPIEVEGGFRLCPWLTWKDPESDLESDLPTPDLWENIEGYAKGHLTPRAAFLGYPGAGTRSDLSGFDIDAFYEQVIMWYHGKGITELTAWRDAYAEQLDRIGEKTLQKAVAPLTGILRISAKEAVASCNEKERRYIKQVLRICRLAMDYSRLTPIFERVPPLWRRVATLRIAYLMHERRKILQSAHSLNQKRLVLEYVLSVTLEGKRVPALEKVEGELTRKDERRKIYTGSAEEFWAYAQELYKEKYEEGDSWQDVYESMSEEQASLGLTVRHTSFESFKSARKRHNRKG